MAARKKNRNLLEDPRYAEFVQRYHADPMRFAVEVTGFIPSADQEDLFRAITPENAKVSVVSGTGKTASFARIALWHLLCFPVAVYEGKVEVGSNTYIGAPFIQQVADGIWKEMQDARIAIANGPQAWINDFFTITKTRVHVNGYAERWLITQIALKKGEAIGVAGKHRYWQLIIIDEAAGVSDDHFNVIDGTQTQGGNRTLMASQGARNAGRFYDAHHRLKHGRQAIQRHAVRGRWRRGCDRLQADRAQRRYGHARELGRAVLQERIQAEVLQPARVRDGALRDAIRQGRVVLPQGIAKKLREKIIDQGSRLQYHFSEAGGLRYVMQSKEDMRRDGIRSPDLIDAISFAFLEGATYMVHGGAGSATNSLTDSVSQKAAEMFAGVQ